MEDEDHVLLSCKKSETLKIHSFQTYMALDNPGLIDNSNLESKLVSLLNLLNFLKVNRTHSLIKIMFPPPINRWPPRYNWDIVESDVKHHNPNPNPK